MRIATILFAVLLPFAARANDTARAEIKNASGKVLGTLVFSQTEGGVRVTGDLKDLPSGLHGIHIHETGQCSAPDFKSAGEHFNPTGKQHGDKNPQGPHAGDLGNITVTTDGKASVNALAKGATIGPGSASLVRNGGAAVVIHAKADDLSSDPAGNSGDRIACGEIRK